MTKRSVTPPAAKGSTPLADAKIQQLAQQLVEAIDSADAIDEFAEFEHKVLEIGNEVCRQAIKRNSRR